MKVLGLAMDSANKVPILVLRSITGKEVLPLWIGGVEAMSISLAFNDIQAERPLTHDLFISMLGKMQSEIAAATITDVRGGIFYAVLDILHNGKLMAIDCRPSDAIALALRVSAPIRVLRSVLQKAPHERYMAAMSGQSLVPDETGNIVLRSLRQVENMMESSKLKDNEADSSTVAELASPFTDQVKNSATASEEDMFLRMLQELEPASRNKM